MDDLGWEVTTLFTAWSSKWPEMLWVLESSTEGSHILHVIPDGTKYLSLVNSVEPTARLWHHSCKHWTIDLILRSQIKSNKGKISRFLCGCRHHSLSSCPHPHSWSLTWVSCHFHSSLVFQAVCEHSTQVV